MRAKRQKILPEKFQSDTDCLQEVGRETIKKSQPAPKINKVSQKANSNILSLLENVKKLIINFFLFDLV